jgi:hypothetical protein
MLTLRRPEIPTHVLERQPWEKIEAVRPNLLARGLKRLMPRLIDWPAQQGTVFFVTETSAAGCHSLDYKVRESGKIVADRFQPQAGHGCVWTNDSGWVNTQKYGVVERGHEGVDNQPLFMRRLKDLGVFPILEDPYFTPGDIASDATKLEVA